MKPSPPCAKQNLAQITAELSAVASMAAEEVEELSVRTQELQQRVTHLRSMVDLIERRIERGEK